MGTISLATYTVRVFPRIQNQQLIINNFGDHNDLLDILRSYSNERSRTLFNNRENQFLFRAERIHRVRRSISGIFMKGEYGIESDLVDVEDHSLSYERDINDAEMLPFYFLFILPLDADEGFLALQRTGVMGIKGSLEFDLRSFFEQQFPDFRIEINRLIPEQLIAQYFDRGRAVKIRFVKFGIPQDITNLVDLGHEENEGTTELQIRAKRGRALAIRDRVTEVLQRRRNVQEFIELRHFEYDNVKIELEISGRYRTIDLGHPDYLRAEYDITEEIEIQGGNPVFESIDAIARNLMSDIIKEVGLGEDDV